MIRYDDMILSQMITGALVPGSLLCVGVYVALCVV